MYQISNYSGKIKHVPSGIVFLNDSTDINYPDYLEWLQSGNSPEMIDFFEGEEAEKTALDKLSIETAKYIQRSNDGRDAYAKISAEFRLAKLYGQITEEAHAIVEKILIPVRNEILAGQWISGQNELVLIGSSVIGQQLYDRLYNQMDAYIQVSYTVDEINSNKSIIKK